jgi:hypothetical protein
VKRTAALLVFAVIAAAAMLGLAACIRETTGAIAAVQVPAAPSTCAEPAQAGVHRAGLVITFGPGDTARFCVQFTEDAISGIELLERAGVTFVAASEGGLGQAVCSIEGVGCDNPGDCFCQCQGGTCEYWSYFSRQGGGWRYENRGASNRMLHDGDVDGWAWGPGSVTGGTQPAAPGSGLCPEPTPTRPPPPNPTAARRPTPRPAGGQQPPPAPSNDGESSSNEARSGDTVQGNATPDQSHATPQPTAGATTQPRPTETPSSSVRGAIATEDAPGDSPAAADEGGGGGGATPLILFGVVGAGLLGTAGLVWYRRSRNGG